MGRPPYDAVVRLIAWTAEHRHYLRGKIRLAGLGSLDVMHPSDALDLVMAVSVDANGPGALDKISAVLKEPFWRTAETWGTGPQAEAAQAAAEAAMPIDMDDPVIAEYMRQQKELQAGKDDGG